MLGEMRKFFWMLAGLAASLAAGCSNDDGNDGPTVCPDPEPLSQLTADVSLTVQSARLSKVTAAEATGKQSADSYLLVMETSDGAQIRMVLNAEA